MAERHYFSPFPTPLRQLRRCHYFIDYYAIISIISFSLCGYAFMIISIAAFAFRLFAYFFHFAIFADYYFHFILFAFIFDADTFISFSIFRHFIIFRRFFITLSLFSLHAFPIFRHFHFAFIFIFIISPFFSD